VFEMLTGKPEVMDNRFIASFCFGIKEVKRT
jgi:hypothetical protein